MHCYSIESPVPGWLTRTSCRPATSAIKNCQCMGLIFSRSEASANLSPMTCVNALHGALGSWKDLKIEWQGISLARAWSRKEPEGINSWQMRLNIHTTSSTNPGIPSYGMPVTSQHLKTALRTKRRTRGFVHCPQLCVYIYIYTLLRAIYIYIYITQPTLCVSVSLKPTNACRI